MIPLMIARRKLCALLLSLLASQVQTARQYNYAIKMEITEGTMKKAMCIAIAFAVTLLASGCGKTEQNKPQKASEMVVSAKPEKDYSAVKDCFSGLENAWEIIASDKKSYLEVSVKVSGISSDAKPDNWEDLQTAFVDCTTDAKFYAEQEGFSSFVSQMQSDDGTILITLHNGKILYDVFEEHASYKDGKITLEIFNQLTTDMTYKEVRDLIGADGELLSSVDIGDYSLKTDMYSWQGKGITGANATVTFQGGKLTVKAQFGLA